MFFLVDRSEATACPLLKEDTEMTYACVYLGVRAPLFEIGSRFSRDDLIGITVNFR